MSDRRTYPIDVDGALTRMDPAELTVRHGRSDEATGVVWQAKLPHQCDDWVIAVDADPTVVARRLRTLAATLQAAAADLEEHTDG